MTNLLFSLNTVTPVFLIILPGFYLKRREMITTAFIDTSSKVVFNIAMPALVFAKLASADFQSTFQIKPILIAYFGTISFFGIAWLLAIVLTKEGKDQGAFHSVSSSTHNDSPQHFAESAAFSKYVQAVVRQS